MDRPSSRSRCLDRGMMRVPATARKPLMGPTRRDVQGCAMAIPWRAKSGSNVNRGSAPVQRATAAIKASGIGVPGRERADTRA